jgi:hypothetical protein
MQQRMIDDAVVGLLVVCVWGDVADLDVSKICNGASLWLLGVAAARKGFSIFLCRAYVCRIITVVNGRLKFEMTILYFI